MPEGMVLKPSAHRHAGTAASREWAERVEMREIVERWVWTNNFRWMIAAVAAGLSGYGTLCC
jgi:hypothetical protein